MDVAGRIPTTYLAFDGDGPLVDDLLGSVSLIDDDELDGYRDVRPWLASLYVVPAARGAAWAPPSTRLAVERARALGVDAAPPVHRRAGGVLRRARLAARGQRAMAGDETATVMAIDTDPWAPRRALVTRWCTDPERAHRVLVPAPRRHARRPRHAGRAGAPRAVVRRRGDLAPPPRHAARRVAQRRAGAPTGALAAGARPRGGGGRRRWPGWPRPAGWRTAAPRWSCSRPATRWAAAPAPTARSARR